MNNLQKALIVLAAIVVAVAFCGGFYLILTADQLAANIRDVLIIVLALESLLIGAGLLLMIWQLYSLVVLLRNEVLPLIHTTKATVEQVQHTTTFIGQSVAEPVVSVRGWLAGTKAMVDTLRGKKEPHELLQTPSHEVKPYEADTIKQKE